MKEKIFNVVMTVLGAVVVAAWFFLACSIVAGLGLHLIRFAWSAFK